MSARTSVKIHVDPYKFSESSSEKYNAIESRYSKSKKTDIDKIRRMMEVKDLISLVVQVPKIGQNIAQQIYALSALNSTWIRDSDSVLGKLSTTFEELIVKMIS